MATTKPSFNTVSDTIYCLKFVCICNRFQKMCVCLYSVCPVQGKAKSCWHQSLSHLSTFVFTHWLILSVALVHLELLKDLSYSKPKNLLNVREFFNFRAINMDYPVKSMLQSLFQPKPRRLNIYITVDPPGLCICHRVDWDKHSPGSQIASRIISCFLYFAAAFDGDERGGNSVLVKTAFKIRETTLASPAIWED